MPRLAWAEPGLGSARSTPGPPEIATSTRPARARVDSIWRLSGIIGGVTGQHNEQERMLFRSTRTQEGCNLHFVAGAKDHPSANLIGCGVFKSLCQSCEGHQGVRPVLLSKLKRSGRAGLLFPLHLRPRSGVIISARVTTSTCAWGSLPSCQHR